VGSELYTFDLKRSHLYEQVAEQLQELVISESLAAGDRLPGERALAKRLGISRPVLREAIRVLEGRGLLKVKPGLGTYVCDMSAHDASAPLSLMLKLGRKPHLTRDLTEVRRMIEIEGAGLAAVRATDDDIAALEETIEAMDRAQHDAQAYTDHDLAFHLLLAKATHNSVVPRLLAPITDLLSGLILLSLQTNRSPQVGLFHHRRIIDCVRQRDTEAARLAMRSHLDASEQLVSSAQD